MRLVYHGWSRRRRWTIGLEGAMIPVQQEGWYRLGWTWPSGDEYLMDMRGEISLRRNGEAEVARRRRLGWTSGHRGTWDGLIRLAYTWRDRGVWFRGQAGELVMWARARCWPGPYCVIIRDAIDTGAWPVLCGIAMATFVNFDG